MLNDFVGHAIAEWNVYLLRCVAPSFRLFLLSLRRAKNTKAKRYELFNNVRAHIHTLSRTMSDTFCIVQMKHLKFDKWQNAKRLTITENLSLLSVRSKSDGWERKREREKMQILLLLMRIHVHNKFHGKHTAETGTLADNEMALKIVHGKHPFGGREAARDVIQPQPKCYKIESSEWRTNCE